MNKAYNPNNIIFTDKNNCRNSISITENDTGSFMALDFHSIFPDVPFVVINDIFVERKDRGKGIATQLFNDVADSYKNHVILVIVGIHNKEYGDEPAVIDKLLATEILNKVATFYEKNNFVNINHYIGGYQFRRAYMYIGNEIGKDIYEKFKQMGVESNV